MSGDAAELVVVSPHLDDAVLSAWCVLARRPGAEVVTCFAGLPDDDTAGGDWDVATGGPTGRAAVVARRREDREALARCRSTVTHLDLPDAQYRRDDAGVVEQLTEVLRPRLAGRREVWLPAGIGGHPDHVLAREATLAALPGEARRVVYADLPYAGQPAWPARLSGGVRDRAVEVVASRLGAPTPADRWRTAVQGLPGLSPGDPRLVRLTAAERRAKWAAVQCYGSQLAALRVGHRHLLRRRRVFAFEAYWP